MGTGRSRSGTRRDERGFHTAGGSRNSTLPVEKEYFKLGANYTKVQEAVERKLQKEDFALVVQSAAHGIETYLTQGSEDGKTKQGMEAGRRQVAVSFLSGYQYQVTQHMERTATNQSIAKLTLLLALHLAHPRRTGIGRRTKTRTIWCRATYHFQSV